MGDSDGFLFEMDELVATKLESSSPQSPPPKPIPKQLAEVASKPAGRAILTDSDKVVFPEGSGQHWIVARYQALREADPDLGVVLVVTKTLVSVIEKTEARTYYELLQELEKASATLRELSNSIGVHFGVELFRQLTAQKDEADFTELKKRLVAQAHAFVEKGRRSRDLIASFAQQFIQDDMTVLTHGYSRSVVAVFQKAVENNKRFNVIVTEARPTGIGYQMLRTLQDLGLSVSFVVDAAVAHIMHQVDAVIFGAEGILENGGIINSIGTYNVALIASTFKKPVYVCSESFKFSRKFYPLDQGDIQQFQVRKKLIVPPHIQQAHTAQDSHTVISAEALAQTKILNPSIDWTPPQYITLLFTDLGPLSPSAVSDELIKLYY